MKNYRYLLLQRELAEDASGTSCAHRRRNQRGWWANRLVHISDPAEGAAAMGKRGGVMAALIVGNGGKHAVNGLWRQW